MVLVVLTDPCERGSFWRCHVCETAMKRKGKTFASLVRRCRVKGTLNEIQYRTKLWIGFFIHNLYQQIQKCFNCIQMCKKTLLVLSSIQMNNKQVLTLENWPCKLEWADPFQQKRTEFRALLSLTKNIDYNFCIWLSHDYTKVIVNT